MSNVLRTNENLGTVKGRKGGGNARDSINIYYKEAIPAYGHQWGVEAVVNKKRDHSDTEWPLDILGL